MRRRYLVAGATAVWTVGVLAQTACQSPTASDSGDYPDRPVTIVAPFAPGGSIDTDARVLAECLSASGGEWVVENHEGGGGTIGTTDVANAQPDGYTLGYIPSSTITLTPLVSEQETQYQPEDLRPLVVATSAPAVLVTAGDSPFASAEDFFAGEERRTIATTTALGIYQLLVSELSKTESVEGVPFGGIAPAITAALGGNADAAMVQVYDSAVQQIESGELRALAVATDGSASPLPGVPTFAELGYDLPPAENSGALFAPADTPDDIAGVISDRTTECLSSPEVTEQIGTDYLRDPPLTGSEAQQLITDTISQYRTVLGN